MGCDIHFYREVKIDGKWRHYGECNIDRDYNLFAKMAGVRNYQELKPISQPKGLPEDVSFMTKFHYERQKEDWHSASWLDKYEITELYEWLENRMGEKSWSLEREYWGYLFGNGWNLAKYPEDWPEDIEDIRFVFWFDN